MAYEKIAKGNSAVVSTDQFVCETAEDAKNLPASSPFGSIAIVVEDEDEKVGLRIKTTEWKKV